MLFFVMSQQDTALGIYLGENAIMAAGIVNNADVIPILFNGSFAYPIPQIKQFLGLKSSERTRRLLKSQNSSIQLKNSSLILNDQKLELVLATHLSQVASIASLQLNATIQHIVIAVPTVFTEQQRTAVVQAAKISKLLLLQIINEPAAAGMGINDNGRFGVIINKPTCFQIGFLRKKEKQMQVISVNGYEQEKFDAIKAQQFIQTEMKTQHFMLSSLYVIGNEFQSSKTLIFKNESVICNGAALQAGMLLKNLKNKVNTTSVKPKEKYDIKLPKTKEEIKVNKTKEQIKANKTQMLSNITQQNSSENTTENNSQTYQLEIRNEEPEENQIQEEQNTNQNQQKQETEQAESQSQQEIKEQEQNPENEVGLVFVADKAVEEEEQIEEQQE
ncbi:Fe-S_protein [Hexamita inflata]|uniref:Fe-S protein n=1 Tax=Hexamita inflata TaxID=28002 RepID=A0AA86PVV1_9EUKA|nr:Fe-S protein [Hexamita inflata]